MSESAGNVATGELVITNTNGNNWVCTGSWFYNNVSDVIGVTSGIVYLDAVLDRVSLASNYPANSSFDAGAFVVSYQ